MPEFPIRKVALLAEEIFHEGEPAAGQPRPRAHNRMGGPAAEDIKAWDGLR